MLTRHRTRRAASRRTCSAAAMPSWMMLPKDGKQHTKLRVKIDPASLSQLCGSSLCSKLAAAARPKHNQADAEVKTWPPAWRTHRYKLYRDPCSLLVFSSLVLRSAAISRLNRREL